MTIWSMGGPSQEVIQIGPLLIDKFRHCRVVDLGAGAGRNSVFMSGIGADVTAVERSNALADQARRNQSSLGTRFRVVELDASEFSPDPGVALCIALGILHFVPSDQALALVERMKSATATGGVHLITIAHEPGGGALAHQGHLNSISAADLLDAYRDWTCLAHETYVKRDYHLNNEYHVHSIDKLVFCNATSVASAPIKSTAMKLRSRPDQAVLEQYLSSDPLNISTLAVLRRDLGAEDSIHEFAAAGKQMSLLMRRDGYALQIAFWGRSKCYFENGILVGHARYDSTAFHTYERG